MGNENRITVGDLRALLEKFDQSADLTFEPSERSTFNGPNIQEFWQAIERRLSDGKTLLIIGLK